MVVPVDNRLHVGTGRAIGRGLLIALVIPPLFTDADGAACRTRPPAPPSSGVESEPRTGLLALCVREF